MLHQQKISNGVNQTQTTLRIKKTEGLLKLLEITRQILKKITARSGKWDAAKVIREIRYAK